MEHLEYPIHKCWTDRRVWFEELFDVERRGGGYIIGEHALGLLIDLQATFCAGAWMAAVILAATVIDAHLREAELSEDFEGGIKAAFEVLDDPGLEWLRQRRNQLVHFNSEKGAAVTVETQWIDRESLEKDARRAIEMVANALFAQPWT